MAKIQQYGMLLEQYILLLLLFLVKWVFSSLWIQKNTMQSLVLCQETYLSFFREHFIVLCQILVS